MSIRAISEVWENGPDDQADLLVMLALADHADDAGRCWPSVFTIAQKSRMSERNVRRVLTRLVQTGWIDAERSGGRNKPSIYRLTPVSWPQYEREKRASKVPDRVRAAVYERDGYECTYCGTSISKHAADNEGRTLDHVVPVSRGGDHSKENLVVSCQSCNSVKGARTPSEWLAATDGEKPDKLAAFCAVLKKGGHAALERRTHVSQKADTALTAEPSGTINEPSGGAVAPATPPKKPKKRKSQIGDWRPSDDEIKNAAATLYGSTDAIALGRAEQVCAAFVDHAQANGRVLLDWSAGWRMWVSKEADFMRRRQG